MNTIRTNKIYNMAIIGCGRISYKHVKAAIDNSDRIHLVAVCDLIEENANLQVKKYKEESRGNLVPEVFTDYKEMLKAHKNIDIVSICTESGFHAEIAVFCMKKGMHVLVEKPMALSTKDADEMIRIADQYHVKLCVSHQNRFNPPIQRLRQAVEGGRFGRIISGNARILWNRGPSYYSQAPWRGTYAFDGGCLMNQCIHNIDLLQWMLGSEFEWINGVVDNFSHPYIEGEDYGSIQIKFKNGAIGNVEGTICVYPSNLEETLTIIGEKGIASIGGIALNKIETWRFEDGLDREDEIMNECNLDVDSVYGNGHTPLYKDFIDSLDNNTEPFINGETGKKAVEIILAAYKSSKEGHRISSPVGTIESIEFK